MKVTWDESFNQGVPIDEAIQNDDDFLAIVETAGVYDDATTQFISNLVQGISVLKGVNLWPSPADVIKETTKQLDNFLKKSPRGIGGSVEDFLLPLYDSLTETVKTLYSISVDLDSLADGLKKPVKVKPGKPKVKPITAPPAPTGDLMRLERDYERSRPAPAPLSSPSSKPKPKPKVSPSKPKKSFGGGWQQYVYGVKTPWLENLENKMSLEDAFAYDGDYLTLRETINLYSESTQNAYVYILSAENALESAGLWPTPSESIGTVLSDLATFAQGVPRQVQGRAKDTILPVQDTLKNVMNSLYSMQGPITEFVDSMNRVDLKPKSKRKSYIYWE